MMSWELSVVVCPMLNVACTIDICSSCKDDDEATACQAEEVQPVRVEVTHGGGDAQLQDPIR